MSARGCGCLVILAVLILTLLCAAAPAIAYGAMYGVKYAQTQSFCVSLSMRAYVTWDLQPYCVAVHEGTEYWLPVRFLEKKLGVAT